MNFRYFKFGPNLMAGFARPMININAIFSRCGYCQIHHIIQICVTNILQLLSKTWALLELWNDEIWYLLKNNESKIRYLTSLKYFFVIRLHFVCNILIWWLGFFPNFNNRCVTTENKTFDQNVTRIIFPKRGLYL